MTSAELLAAIRIRFDDVATPYLASDATILEQASLAQMEFARSTLVLYHDTTAAITASNPWLELPANFYVLKTVTLSGLQLRPLTISELDFGYFTFGSAENSKRFANWRVATGTPRFVVTDMYPDRVRLVPIPTASGTVTLEGYVAPPNLKLAVISPPADAVNPQIPEVYHELLITGTLFRLNMQTDIDTFNQGKAQLYSTLWYQGIAEAQNNLRTSLRRQVRVMELPRTFAFDVVNAPQAADNEQSG
jgi:hypothetical protein